MKKYTSFFPPLLVMLIIAGSFQYEAKGQQLESVEGIWSGTVSMDIRADVTTGWSESHINTFFTDNKGHGTVKAESEPTGVYKKIGMGNTACDGQGVAKLIYLKFNSYKKTYRIEVKGPDCSNGPNPNSNHRNDILIADKPLAGNPNLLSGTERTVSQMPGGGGTVTITITWNLKRECPPLKDTYTDKRIATLKAKMKDAVSKFINRVNDELCIQLRVAQALRTIAEQNELYAQGRTKPGKIVTNAKGGQSNHNSGLAIDVYMVNRDGTIDLNKEVPPDVVKIAKEEGFEWGGDWKKFKDYPHFEMKK